MDLHYKQEVTVGGLVLLAIVMFVAGTMWLSGRSLQPKGNTVVVRFANVSTLKPGNQVKVSGVTLGTVQGIAFQGYGDVLVTLDLSRKIQPKQDAAAELVSVGLIGDMYVAFNPGTAADALPPGQVIQGTVAQGLSELGTDLGREAKATMSGVQEVVNKRLAEDLHQTLEAMERFMALYADTSRGPTAELTQTMASLQRLSTRLDSTLGDSNIGKLLANADTATVGLTALTRQFTTTAARLDSVLTKVNGGQGTLGKFANDSTFYTEMTETSRSLRRFIDDLTKHPGKLGITVKIF